MPISEFLKGLELHAGGVQSDLTFTNRKLVGAKPFSRLKFLFEEKLGPLALFLGNFELFSGDRDGRFEPALFLWVFTDLLFFEIDRGHIDSVFRHDQVRLIFSFGDRKHGPGLLDIMFGLGGSNFLLQVLLLDL